MSKQKTFFSYSRVDSDFVLKLAKDLRDAGAAVWLDQLDIKPGSHWDSSIEEALDTSNSMIIVLSATSVASNNVMDEVSFALENDKTVIPVLIDQCNVPFRLKRVQRIDFTGDYQKALDELVDVLGYSTDNNLLTPGTTQQEEVNTKPADNTNSVKAEESKTAAQKNVTPIKSGPSPKAVPEKVAADETKPSSSSKKYLVIAGFIGIAVFALWAILHFTSGKATNKTALTDTLSLKDLSLALNKCIAEIPSDFKNLKGAIEPDKGNDGDKLYESKWKFPNSNSTDTSTTDVKYAKNDDESVTIYLWVKLKNCEEKQEAVQFYRRFNDKIKTFLSDYVVAIGNDTGRNMDKQHLMATTYDKGEVEVEVELDKFDGENFSVLLTFSKP